ncbi:MAG: GntR family transcriptional regulator [Colwellia sp.]|nr:GntR family transcriptional regulator [Colwellia sp.]
MSKPSVLKIKVVTGDIRPIFKQIIDGIRLEIATEKLSPGSKLPSYRGLAMQLMINPNTVAKAYAELSKQGLIESKKGLGLFVSENRQSLSDDEREQKLAKAVTVFINETVHLNYSDDEIVEVIKNKLKEIKTT